MKLSILMAGLHSRPRHIENQIVTQIHQLAPFCDVEKISAADTNGVVTTVHRPTYYSEIKAEFITLIDNGEMTSGQKRNRLTKLAKGDYICFVDDDDLVSPIYVEQMVHGCLTKADVVSFCLELFYNGVAKEKWRFMLHPNQRRFGLMCVNHLCAWKKEIATRVGWDPLLGNSDDRVWFEPLFNGIKIASNYYINEILYQYKYEQTVTTNQHRDRIAFAKNYIGKGLRCFTDDCGEIYVETNPRFTECSHVPTGHVLVRNYKNDYSLKPLSELNHYHTVRA